MAEGAERTWGEMFNYQAAELRDALQSTLLEHVGGRIHPSCGVDFWQQITRVASRTTENLPSDTIMAGVPVSLKALVYEDPTTDDAPFGGVLAEQQFLLMALKLDHGRQGKLWYLNDRTGMKYLASAAFPAKFASGQPCNAASLAEHLWQPTNWRHVHSTDDAPNIVALELGNKSRLEYHKMPVPHPFTKYVAQGMEYDSRDGVVLSQYEVRTFVIGGKQVQGHMLYMKSVVHPAFPEFADPTCSGEERKPIPPEEDPNFSSTGVFASQVRSKGMVETPFNEDDVEPKKMTGNGRAIIKCRGFLLFDSPADPNKVSVLVFGHEDPVCIVNQVGRLSYYIGLSHLVGGGADMTAAHILNRFAHLVAKSPSGGR